MSPLSNRDPPDKITSVSAIKAILASRKRISALCVIALRSNKNEMK